MSRLADLIATEKLSARERNEMRDLFQRLEADLADASGFVTGQSINIPTRIIFQRALDVYTSGMKRDSPGRGVRFLNRASGGNWAFVGLFDGTHGELQIGVDNRDVKASYITIRRDPASPTDTSQYDFPLLGGSSGASKITQGSETEIWAGAVGEGETTVFNNSGRDIDFRIEGATVTDVFRLDAGNEQVSVGGFFNLKYISELTIASGEITATGSYHSVDTESDDASDDLDTINGGAIEGNILVLRGAIPQSKMPQAI